MQRRGTEKPLLLLAKSLWMRRTTYAVVAALALAFGIVSLTFSSVVALIFGAAGAKGLFFAFASLLANLKTGVVMLAGTFLLAGWGTALMLLSWVFGWDNSFYRGYEQREVGQVLGVAGWVAVCLTRRGAPTRRRRSLSDTNPPSAASAAPSQIQGASGLW